MEIHTLDDFVCAATECCGNGWVHNLCLSAEFPISEFDEPFANAWMDEAKAWQNVQRPQQLHINHGEYIHKYGNAYEFLVDELRRKPDSNRALFSLIDMKSIIDSGDRPIPSFLILQFGKRGPKLFVSAYFRSLEVHNFLAVNLSEIALVVQELCAHLGDLESVELCIHAFRAYCRPEFDLIHRAEIDCLAGFEIATIVFEQDRDTLRRLLENKLAESTVIETKGIAELHGVLQARSRSAAFGFSQAFVEQVGAALEALSKLRGFRGRGSHTAQVDKWSKEVKRYLSDALREL